MIRRCSRAAPVNLGSSSGGARRGHAVRRRGPAVLVAAGLLSGGPGGGQDAPAAVPPVAAGGTEEQFDAWTLRCVPASESQPKRCEMVQAIGDTKSKRELLLVAIGYPDGGSRPLAWLVVPLGVLLPPGLGLKVDGGEPRGLPIRSCDPRGCATPWQLTDEDIAILKQGQELIVIVHDITGKKLGLPVSLKGFTAAFSRLQ